ncbi:MAG: tRNA preQ1(34) S-adenosylmethionine ribosyltransferase-isomerase QueA [Puniceicoccales bacterium]|jgi:S-adenosylmethionine:tRNA ribosyltransferase-isomerase|nr:tRNA preQ1(34) S-adenosylmethionine ribosyltransferase-isomerase QueA [Puniceicoccales bacterium]
MNTALFDYELPPELIADTPASRRDASRLMLVRRAARTVSHHHFHELPALLPARTVLFRNNARVLRARLAGERPGGGRVECLLLRPAGSPETWWCLLKPGKKAAAAGFALPGPATATVLGQSDGEYRVHFTLPAGETVLTLSEKKGELPLPPYIERARRERGTPPCAQLDHERYQTLYADPRRTVAAAAPTAGLHFSEAVLSALGARGIPCHDLTLHVGLGTFQPMKTETVEEHTIHREFYEIPSTTLAAFDAAVASNAPRLAVGTTTLRALEDHARKHEGGRQGVGAATGMENADARTRPPAAGGNPVFDEAGLFIHPPCTFLGADALLTNFHLPRSTLLCLVSAFLSPGTMDGIEWFKSLYAEAIARSYRFYSYGDAMLILD